MLAYRSTWIVKQGCMSKALELLSAEIERVGTRADRVTRVYTPNFSPNVLVFDDNWENQEAHDKFWELYWKSSESKAFFTQWNEFVERSTGTELWNVKEWR